jgi:hypothetical protein
MYISLKTIKVWEIIGLYEAPAFFRALRYICLSNDILVIGSYNPSEESLEWLLLNEVSIEDHRKPFSDSFDINKREYPLGRAYPLHAEDRILDDLARMSENKKGSRDKELFFDHVLLYRVAEPLVPLFNFHDAFTGGQLLLSGLYLGKTVNSFACAIGAKNKLVDNPEI